MKLLLTLVVLFSSTAFALDQEGGYAGTTDQGHAEVVYNFLKNFAYEDYYWAKDYCFTTDNDWYMDRREIVIYAGHGCNWGIGDVDGKFINLKTLGVYPQEGYGDKNKRLKYIAFESCEVIPTPAELTDWWTGWVNSNGVFDGLHMALGFHTSSYQSTDQNISEEFGKLVKEGKGIWQAWFDAIDKKGARSWCWTHWRMELTELGSAVMYPACDGETYYKQLAEPPINHQNLYYWYQKRD